MNDQIMIGSDHRVHDTIRLAAPRRFPEIDESRLQLSQRLGGADEDNAVTDEAIPRLIDTLDSRTLKGLPLRPRSANGEPRSYSQDSIPAPSRSPRPRTPAVRVASSRAAGSVSELRPRGLSVASVASNPIAGRSEGAVRLETVARSVEVRPSGRFKTVALGVTLAALAIALLVFLILPAFGV